MIDPKSVAALEFPKVVARLAAHCGSPGGRALALALTPSGDLDEVRRRQTGTAEARALSRIKPNFHMGQAPDIAALLLAASRSSVLPATDILEIGVVLRSARHTRNHIAPLGRELPWMARLAQRIADFSPLIQRIERTIDERGEIPDDASPQLADLRRELRVVQERLEQHLERIMRRAVSEGIAQEALITERDGRYVIPIKAESRGALPSVVHDVSQSGATLFVEPLAAVEMGNRLREARREEEREVERILRALCREIGDDAGAIRAALGCLAEIDLARAKAALGAELDAPLPIESDSLAWLVPSEGELHLHSARHPLLSGDVVPISITLTRDDRCVLITGPNTGGKTVALKTVGLLCLMAQAGLPVPAEVGTRLPVFEDIFADIGDEQSIEQSLSTFSAHMTNIIRILGAAGPPTLVLLDELGAGTDPTEGSALARSLLEELLQLEAAVVATTHHGELKVFAHTTPGVVNASAEFDAETLRPTYRLLMGTPGRSNALAIAQRLGMPSEVIARARREADSDTTSVEQLLGELQRERDALASERKAEESTRAEAEEIRQGLAERRAAIEAERDGILAKAERAMEDELAALRRASRITLKEIERQRSRDTAEELAERRADESRERLQRVRRERSRRRQRTRAPEGEPVEPSQLGIGDYVYLSGFAEPGEVLSPVDDGALEVRLGSLRTRVRVEQVERRAPNRTAAQTAAPRVQMPRPPVDPGSKIDVRGRTTEEALPMVDSFLDLAYRAGQSRLEVVHGKGTGALRKAVRGLLREQPLVTSFESAAPRAGGDGVTVVQLVR